MVPATLTGLVENMMIESDHHHAEPRRIRIFVARLKSRQPCLATATVCVQPVATTDRTFANASNLHTARLMVDEQLHPQKPMRIQAVFRTNLPVGLPITLFLHQCGFPLHSDSPCQSCSCMVMGHDAHSLFLSSNLLSLFWKTSNGGGSIPLPCP